MRIEVYAEKNSRSELAGTIETAPGVGESFTYSESWLTSENARPLSLSLPLSNNPFAARKMRPYFEGLLPEGAARSAIATRLHVSYAAYLKLLEAVGHECIGAISLQGPSEMPEDGYFAIDESLLESLSERSYPVAAESSERTRFSLAGSQAKIALYKGQDNKWYEPVGLAPSTHILKPAGQRFPEAAVNELICTMVASKCGLDVPKVELINISGPIICTERFDRSFSESTRKLNGLPVPVRLHQEDFCQATGTVPEHKYEEGGIRYLDKVVSLIGDASTSPIVDLEKLWDLIAFNYLIGNCDAHLKNIALLRDSSWRELRLAPAYDLVCTSCYSELSRKLAMSIGNARSLDDVTADSFEALAASMSLPRARVMARLEGMSRMISGAIEEALTELGASGIECTQTGEGILRETHSNIKRL